MYIPDKIPNSLKCENPMLILYLFNKCGWLGIVDNASGSHFSVGVFKAYSVIIEDPSGSHFSDGVLSVLSNNSGLNAVTKKNEAANLTCQRAR